MKKSVYSLVLSDAVIAGIDRMAYSMGMSRSALINKILAEQISYVTPEQRINDIFGELETLMRNTESFRIAMQPTGSVFSLNSALAYKYNPTIKYSLELYKSYGNRHEFGILRISMRSKNAALLALMQSFFGLFSSIENKYTGHYITLPEIGRYEKKLKAPNHISDAKLGEGIAAYINTVDTAMKLFFSYVGDTASAAAEIEKLYVSYLKNKAILI